jgi:uncharacterized protein (DUF433 family)
MSLPERITVDPEILAGKPIVRGTRLAVEFILGLLAADQSEDQILKNYPESLEKISSHAWRTRAISRMNTGPIPFWPE